MIDWIKDLFSNLSATFMICKFDYSPKVRYPHRVRGVGMSLGERNEIESKASSVTKKCVVCTVLIKYYIYYCISTSPFNNSVTNSWKLQWWLWANVKPSEGRRQPHTPTHHCERQSRITVTMSPCEKEAWSNAIMTIIIKRKLLSTITLIYKKNTTAAQGQSIHHLSWPSLMLAKYKLNISYLWDRLINCPMSI